MPSRTKIIKLKELKSDINLVNYKGKEFFITKNEDKFFLISRTCPHMGGLIQKKDKRLFCPLHNWWFYKDGICKNSTQNAFSIKLEIEGNYLTANANELIEFEGTNYQKNNKCNKLDFKKLNDIPKINLHSHASLELEFREKIILFDPWLDGPAMLGSWRQYPKPIVSGSDLDPDYIIITHEHSDHFHLPTLKAIGKDKLIIFPDFKNNRISSFLKKNNFNNFKALDFEKKFQIEANTYITFFRPKSLFLDSIALFERNSFRFLNLNDAGLNPNIADRIGPVHLLACIFSTGASGYPLCWSQLSDSEKKEIMINACNGRLEMLVQAISMYKSDFIIPFASHVRFWLEQHKKYRNTLITNNINNVIGFFKQKKKMDHLIPLIPGDSYDLMNNYFLKKTYNKDKIYDKDYIEKELNEDRKSFKGSLLCFGYSDYEYSLDNIVKYFEKLDSTYLNIEEEVFLKINIYGKREDSLIFLFRNGKFEKKSQINKNISLIKMKVLDKVIMQIINGNLSWDEAKVGYWIEWWRNTPRVHNLLTRTMQGPNISNKEFCLSNPKDIFTTEVTPISEILKKITGSNELLEKYGLFCNGCSLSPWETIEDAAKAHNLSKAQKNQLDKDFQILLKKD